MNLAVDFIMSKSLKKDDGKKLSKIYDMNGKKIYCINGENAVKYYEMVNFLKENDLEPTIENVKRLMSSFLYHYDPVKKCPFELNTSYTQHISKLKKKRMMQICMESVGLLYMGYQIHSSMNKMYPKSKLKYIPLLVKPPVRVYFST